jgi:YVTN family beta-propeller protein
MSRRFAEIPLRHACAGLAALALAACATSTTEIAQKPLPLHVISVAPLDGTTRRFESQSLDAKTGVLFIADFAAGRVLAFDTKTDRVVKIIRDVPSAQGVLSVPELHRVYVSEPGSFEVAVIDETTYEVIARLPGGRSPSGMAWDPVRRKLYVSDVIGQSETVIDGRNDTRVATIPLGGEVGNSQFDPNENLVYVNVITSNELVAIDPVLDTVIARYPLAGCVGNVGLLLDAVNRLAYIACRGNARLVTFDLRSHRQREALSTGAGPDALAWDAAAALLYVACERGGVSMFHVAGGRLRKVAEGVFGDEAHSLAVDSATHRVYFAQHDAGGRAVIRVAASTVSATLAPR